MPFANAVRLLREDTLPETGPHAVLGVRAIDRVTRAGTSVWVVVDSRSRRVTLRDSAFRVVRQLGRAGQGPGEYEVPIDVRVAADGSIWLVDMSLLRINVYDRQGAFVRALTTVPSNTRHIGLLDDKSLVAFGVVPDRTGMLLATGLAVSGNEQWRSAEANPQLAATRLISDNVWGVVPGDGTALVGASIMPDVIRIDGRSGAVLCRAQIPPQLWTPLQITKRPTSGGLPATTKWLEGASAVTSAVAVSGGTLLLNTTVVDAAGQEQRHTVVFDKQLRASMVLAGTPGRMVLARGDTIYMTRETDEGAVVLAGYMWRDKK